MNSIKEILGEVEKGKLGSKEAAEILRSLSVANPKIKYAKKIKIKIHAREDNKKINLPPIPIWFVEKIALVGVRVSRYFYKKENRYKAKTDEKEKSKLNNKEIEYFRDKGLKIDLQDLKEIFSVLRCITPCTLVEVDNEDAFVQIHMI